MKDLRDLFFFTIHDVHPIGDETVLFWLGCGSLNLNPLNPTPQFRPGDARFNQLIQIITLLYHLMKQVRSQAALERRGNELKRLKGVCLKAKAMMWP